MEVVSRRRVMTMFPGVVPLVEVPGYYSSRTKQRAM
jgi:hypothetical protein